MKPSILFRKSLTPKEEIISAEKAGFNVVFSRVNLADQIVVGRYACLPFYQELVNDLNIQNSKLINSTLEHQYIANFDYYDDIKLYTPKTYFESFNLPDKELVVKGRTNSKKQNWNKSMFAKNKAEALLIAEELRKDSFIGDQGVIFREYVPLKCLEIGINDQPFADEWRFFFYRTELLSYGYYWSQCSKIPSNKDIPPEAIDFATKMAKIISESTTFFVIDIAQTESGQWIVIELNDGQQSGLSENDPDILYSNLFRVLTK